eukprot:6194970-Pleurochrysis_carterae.AAC.4
MTIDNGYGNGHGKGKRNDMATVRSMAKAMAMAKAQENILTRTRGRMPWLPHILAQARKSI